ncbi:MAG TPA: ABC transporter permease [Gemmatimonadaceae bacterium]|nr:ABC transporter permease [Gemmatimonadaceae bacterium]
MDSLLRDAAVALRSLRRSPAFAAVAALTLALGVGATTAIYSVVDAVLLRPLPYAAADRLVVVRQHRAVDARTPMEVSYPDFLDWRAQARSFEAVAAVPSNVSRFVYEAAGGGDAEQIYGALASGELFPTLGARPLLGRTLTPEDDRAGAAPVVVVGHRLWRTRLGGEAAAVGRAITLGGRSYTVVGVMPRGFEFPRSAELWMPLLPAIDSLAQSRQVAFLNVVARLRPGVSVAQADAEMDGVAARVMAASGPPGLSVGATVTPLSEELLAGARPALRILLAAAALLLAVACANVANLMLARGGARRTEMAVRAALGAGRGRLVRQMLVEAGLLSAAGTLLGLVLCTAGLSALVALGPARDLAGAERIGVDARVLAFAAALSLLTAAAFGVMPALRGARTDPAEALRGGAAAGRSTVGAAGRRVLRALVSAQVALAVVLLVGAGLLARSFAKLRGVELGFDRGRTVTAQVYLPEAKYPGPAEGRAFYDELVARAGRLPGVEAAAGVLIRPLEGPDGFDYPFTIEGRGADEQARNPLLNYEAVTPDYFRAMGIPLLRGRGFTVDDRADAPPVALVGRAVADRFWPNGDAVGQRIKWGGPASRRPWVTIVGVAGDGRYRGAQDVTLDVYVPHTQSPWPLNHVVLRAAGPGGAPAAAAALRNELRAIDPGVRAVDVVTVGEMLDRSLSRPRFNALLLGVFAAAALLLGAVGIYGVTAYATAQRAREMGIRVALGARSGDVRALVVREAAVMAGAGIVAGVAAALAASRLLQGLVFGVSTADPLTFVAVPLFLAVVTVAAALGPARRATKADPVQALRSE